MRAEKQREESAQPHKMVIHHAGTYKNELTKENVAHTKRNTK